MTHTEALPAFRAATRNDLPAIEQLLTDAGLPTAGVGALLEADAHQFVVAVERDGAHQVVAVAGLEVCCENALLRFYVLHCVFVPVIATVLIAIHFWRIRKDGGISGPL